MSKKITWIYSQINSNYWIIKTEDLEEFFVFKKNRNNAYWWDEVEAIIIKEKTQDKKAEVEITKIIKRWLESLIGEYIKSKKQNFWFVRVNNTFWGKDIFITPYNSLNAINWDIVKVIITKWTDKPEGKIIEIIWEKDDPLIAQIIVLNEEKVRLDFPAWVIKEANSLKLNFWKNRKDLSNETIITIDWADAKDLDDAISVKKNSDWNYILWVHIADVAEYVTNWSELDKEAYLRWTSIYIPGNVIPMLPKQISDNLCSLNPKWKKLTLSIELLIDFNSWKVLKKDIYESIIQSKAQLTYDEVEQIIEKWKLKIENKTYSEDIISTLQNAYELFQILYKRRKKEWKIEFNFPEIKLEVDNYWIPINVYKRERLESHQLIEEFMIIANEEISKFFNLKKIPFLYRVHEKPSEESLEELIKVLLKNWISVSKETINPLFISQIVDTLWKREDGYKLTKEILMSMSKAKYSDKKLWHYWLSLEYYSHFTSPIRRYPDLQIHRIIKEWIRWKIDKKRVDIYSKKLEKVSIKCSENEQKAEKVEQKITQLYILEYMKKFIWKEFDWMISWITPNWLYIELNSWIEWFVWNRTFWIDWWYNEEERIYENIKTKSKYNLWKKVKIKVSRVDKVMWFLDFELI